jgi:hypothetical protein
MTKTYTGTVRVDDSRLNVSVYPTSLHCYRVGRNITASLDVKTVTGRSEAMEKKLSGTDR